MSEKWIKSSFDKCFELHGNNTLARAQLSNVAGRIQNVHYGDVLVKYSTVVDCDVAQLPAIISEAAHMAGKDYAKDGDIVFADTAEDDTVGKAVEIVNVRDRKVVSGLHTIFARPKFQFASTWLGYYVNSSGFHSQILPYVCGSKVSSISRTNIRKTCVVYPQDISVQRHIAEVLATCDEVIEQSERAAEKYRQIKAGMLNDLLTRGIDNRGRLRPPPSVAPELYKDSELGPIPKEWEVKRLGDCADMFSGGTPSSDVAEYYGGDIPWVSISDMTASGKYLRGTDKCLTEDGYNSCSARKYPPCTLLFAMYASIGKCCIAMDSVTSSQAILGLYNLRGVDLEFLYQNLASREKEFIGMGQTGTQSNLSKQIVESIRLKAPIDVAEQRAIAERLAAVDERIAAEVKTAEKYRKVKAGLMEKLLTPPVDAEIEDLTQEVAG